MSHAFANLQLPKTSHYGRQDASRKQSKGALSGGETIAYADLGAQAFLGADLVGVGSWFARALPCLREASCLP